MKNIRCSILNTVNFAIKQLNMWSNIIFLDELVQVSKKITILYSMLKFQEMTCVSNTKII